VLDRCGSVHSIVQNYAKVREVSKPINVKCETMRTLPRHDEDLLPEDRHVHPGLLALRHAIFD
jgi:hypothetical protein